MRKYKGKIVTAAVILMALAVAWSYGGNYNRSEGDVPPALALSAQTDGDAGEAIATAESAGAGEAAAVAAVGAQEAASGAQMSASETYSGVTSGEQAQTPVPGEQEAASDAQTQVPGEQEAAPPAAQEQDKYKTDPVPEGRPVPVEPQDTTVGDDAFTVTLSVRCDLILQNMNLLKKDKHELVPADGVLFPATVVTAYEGESVFNVFQREMKQARIHMSFRNTPIYNSAYILDVNNLYEFDVGELSGWMYKVNGWFPNYGCSRYQLQPGDVIEWVYTCDLGRDVGGGWIAGRQADD